MAEVDPSVAKPLADMAGRTVAPKVLAALEAEPTRDFTADTLAEQVGEHVSVVAVALKQLDRHGHVSIDTGTRTVRFCG